MIQLLGLLSLGLISCSVDEYRNVQRTKNCAECQQLAAMRGMRGECITDRFCLLSASPKDAGVDAALVRDAATRDAAVSDAAADSAVYANCSEEGKSEFCYAAADQSTSLQAPCRAGTHKCHDGHFGECVGQVLPADEQCNGEDDDCDGRVDEELTITGCVVEGAEGVCSTGAQVCLSGGYMCLQVLHPQSDVCNGDDDDCDGKIDESTDKPCYLAATGCSKADAAYNCTGACQPGIQACKDGAYDETVCDGSVEPASMESCTITGQSTGDEDCDGQFDEGCACTSGNSCYTGTPLASQTQAPCHAGTQTCTDPTHGTCANEVTPQPETCGNEGMDDDCDGTPDNVPARETNCSQQSAGNGICKAGARWLCLDGEQKCIDAAPAAERCDGQKVDEDCDGKVDEGFSLATDAKNCGACGVTCGTGLSCCGGGCVNVRTSNTHCATCGHACGTGQTCCSSSCATLASDPSNCGTCGHVCSGLLKGCTKGVCTKLLL